MAEIDPNTGQAVCPYGTQIKPSFDEPVIDILSGVVIAAVFGTGFAAVIAGAIEALGVHEIAVGDLCASPPPIPADWTFADTVGILTPSIFTPNAYAKLFDWAAVGAWKIACECKPVQIPDFNNASCGIIRPNHEGTSFSAPFSWPGAQVGGIRFTWNVVPAGPIGVDIALQTLHTDGNWFDEWGFRAESDAQPYSGDVTFSPVGSLNNPSITQARVRAYLRDPGPIYTLNWCAYYEPNQATGPEPLPPSQPPAPLPLPPDYHLPPVLEAPNVDLTDLHELRKFVMPASWVPGEPFTVSGAGTHAVPVGTTGLKVELANVAPGADRDAGAPPAYYALGWIAPESTAGARSRWKLDKLDQLLWGLYGTETTIEYNIYPPAAATITPLLRP